MSGPQEDNYSDSTFSYNNQPVPIHMHPGVYVSDLEHRAMEAASYSPSYSYDNTYVENAMYHNGAYGSMQYYPDSSHSEQSFASFPGYAPGMPIQQMNSQSQEYSHFSAGAPQNQGIPNISQEFQPNSSQAYQNDYRSRGRNRNPNRGGANNNRGFHKRGGQRGAQNYNNAYRGGSGYHNDYYENDTYYHPRGNSRGHRGYHAMSFQNRNRHCDDDNTKQNDNYYCGEKQHKKSNRGGKEANFTKYNNTKQISEENLNTASGSASDSKLSDTNNASAGAVGLHTQNGRDSPAMKRSTNISSARGSERDRGNRKAANNKADTRITNDQKKYDYDGKGARPKYGNGRRWDPQITADKDESQRGSLTEQLSRNAYECMVCCEIIKVESAIWSCQNCYHVFHLHCTKKWAHSSLDKDTKVWRCPGCQNESKSIPSQYRCFCGRRKDPTYVRGETPHSCGDACRKMRNENCKHPCTILCHPGPCPSCSSMVNQPCDCGKERKSMRCSVAASYKCDNVCNKLLACGEHQCNEICHKEDCQPCSVSKSQGCYCGRQERSVLCGTLEYDMVSYSCEEPCGKTLSCGNHVCEIACHPGECAPCSSDPSVLTTCCCGKTPLETLNAPERQSCLDRIPTCDNICSKPLVCGPPSNHHLCKKQCHEGECDSCNRKTSVGCQCGRLKKDFPCETAVKFGKNNPFKCQKKCGKKMNCGQHKCTDNCCVKDFHICEKICGAKLSCGVHKCKDLCHSGGCKRCLRTSFDELSCFCGATVIDPPIPCGTKPPECRQLCQRPQKCAHPIRHYCHMDEECPLCAELTEKMCMGGHIVRKNIPCHMKNISCGMPCDKPLPCGIHRCQRVCHKVPCLAEKAVCTMACSKPRPICGHPCSAPCHKGDCPSTVCKTEIAVTCSCGNRSTKTECLVGGDHAAEIAQFQRLSVQSIAESSGGEGVDMAQFDQTKSGARKLDCDDSCAILERNKRFAEALGIKNPEVSGKPGSPTFTDFLKEFGKKNSAFAANVEKSLANLVRTAKKSLHQNRSHSFPSMHRDQRRFVHELAEFYGCQTQSYDLEPNKNVVATAYKDKCRLPSVTLTQFLSKVQVQAPPPLSSLKSQGITFTVLGDKKKAGSSEEDQAASANSWKIVSHGKPSSSSSSSSKPKDESKGAAAAAAPTVDYFDFTES